MQPKQAHSAACPYSEKIYLAISTPAGRMLLLQLNFFSLIANIHIHPFIFISPLLLKTKSPLDCNYTAIFWQGVNLAKVIEAGDFICGGLHRKTNSKVAQARGRTLWRVSVKTMPEYMMLFPLKYCPCCCCLQICCLFCHVHHFILPEVSYPHINCGPIIIFKLICYIVSTSWSLMGVEGPLRSTESLFVCVVSQLAFPVLSKFAH